MATNDCITSGDAFDAVTLKLKATQAKVLLLMGSLKKQGAEGFECSTFDELNTEAQESYVYDLLSDLDYIESMLDKLVMKEAAS